MLLIELTYFCNGYEERGRVSYYIMCARVHDNEVTSWFFQTSHLVYITLVAIVYINV